MIRLHCRSCGHSWYDTELCVARMKYHPTCTKCGKPVEIIRAP